MPLLLCGAAPAQAMPVALGQVAIKLGLELLGGVVDLILNGKPHHTESLAVVDGSHGQDQDSNTDSGFFYADSVSEAGNGNGDARAEAHSQALLLGLAGLDSSVSASAAAADIDVPGHGHAAAANAAVASRGVFKAVFPLGILAARSPVADVPGDLWATLDLAGGLSASASGGGASSATWTVDASLDDRTLFAGTAALGSDGSLAVTGDFQAWMFDLGFDLASQTWQATASPRSFTFLVDHLGDGLARLATDPVVRTYDLSLTNQLAPQAAISSVPEPSPLQMMLIGLAGLAWGRARVAAARV